MSVHTLKNLVKRNAGVTLTPTQFVEKHGKIYNLPIQVGNKVDLKTTDEVTIRAVVESIDAEKLIGRISSISGVSDDSGEYMGMKENELLAFEEQHVLELSIN